MIIKYFIGMALGWIAGAISTIIFVVLRFGIPMCNSLIKNEEEVQAVKMLKKKYFISLIIWIPIISLITFLCFKFLHEGLYGYIGAWAFMILIGWGSTGKTQNNMIEFNNSLQNCKDLIDE